MSETSGCKAFHWRSQTFTSCNRCGQPYWVHGHEERGPFDPTPLLPITPQWAADVKAKWGSA